MLKNCRYQNSNLNGYKFGKTTDGKPGYIPPGGADTVIPFNNLTDIKFKLIATDAATVTGYSIYVVTSSSMQIHQGSTVPSVNDVKPSFTGQSSLLSYEGFRYGSGPGGVYGCGIYVAQKESDITFSSGNRGNINLILGGFI